MPDAAEVAARACALAGRRRDELPDDEVVAELVGYSGGDSAVLEEAWRRCATRDADAVTRAAAALLHRAWARVNGFRETVLVPTRPGTKAPPTPVESPPVPAATALETAGIEAAAPRRGLVGRMLGRLRRGRVRGR